MWIVHLTLGLFCNNHYIKIVNEGTLTSSDTIKYGITRAMCAVSELSLHPILTSKTSTYACRGAPTWGTEGPGAPLGPEKHYYSGADPGGRWGGRPPLARRDPRRRRGFPRLKGRKKGHWCLLNGCSTPFKHNMAINILKSCKSVYEYVKNRSFPSHIRSSFPWRPPLAEILDPRLIFSGFLPLNYVICIFEVRFLSLLLCGRSEEACNMVNSLR